MAACLTCVNVFAKIKVQGRPGSSTGAHFSFSYILNAQALGLYEVEQVVPLRFLNASELVLLP